MAYNIPQLDYYPHLLKLIDGQHTLIGASTGAGKSVLLNAILWSELAQPRINQFIFMATKRVELSMYRQLPHTVRYCQSLPECVNGLQIAVNEIERRYTAMEMRNLRLYDGNTLYIVIDELSDLVLDREYGKVCSALLSKIARVGRAARVLILACTQNANRSILKAEVVSNLPTRIALHCNSEIESRQLINTADAIHLVQGEGICRKGIDYYKFNVPLVPDNELQARVNLWERQSVQQPQPKQKKIGYIRRMINVLTA